MLEVGVNFWDTRHRWRFVLAVPLKISHTDPVKRILKSIDDFTDGGWFRRTCSEKLMVNQA